MNEKNHLSGEFGIIKTKQWNIDLKFISQALIVKIETST